ncbi:MAG: ECF-type sigma factor [Verrucomicrobiota bacterium]|jgi:hypothetical protein
MVKLCYFVRMTIEVTAPVLGISARTAGNYWAHARAWLCREINVQCQWSKFATCRVYQISVA